MMSLECMPLLMVVRYICEELDLAYTKEGGKEDGQTE